MNIPEEAQSVAEKAVDDWFSKVNHPALDIIGDAEVSAIARAALTAAAPLLMAQAWELAPDELLNLPDGAIVIDRHGNPSRCEDGHLGRFITTDDMPFRVVYMPKERP